MKKTLKTLVSVVMLLALLFSLPLVKGERIRIFGAVRCILKTPSLVRALKL